jgi:dethiobiotin synthetase
MTAMFITATGTDIGKTFVTAGLTRALHAAGRNPLALKPVISGFDMADLAASDTGILLAAMKCALTPAQAARISPWRFKAPLSPDMAARLENTELDFGALLAFCRDRIAANDTVLVEGAGGVMSPLDDARTMRDWIAELDIPVMLVTGSYLGAISHCLTALQVLVKPAYTIVVSESAESTVDLDDTVRTIARFADGVPVIALPRSANAADSLFRKLAAEL